MKSLLNKSLRKYVGLLVLGFVASIPAFYFLTKSFYAEDMIDIIESVKRDGSLPPLDLERDIMIGVTIQFFLITIVLCTSLLLMLRFVSRRLWAPFDDTLRKIERYNIAGSDMPEFMPTDVTEFARLNDSIVRLMQKDKDSYRIQKEFTENASHELQTPIAIIRGKLDMLMQEELTERQSKLVSDLYAICTRMDHMNRSLLLFAKIDNDQYRQMETIDVPEALAQMLPMYETLFSGGRITIADRTRSRLTLLANRTLWECLVNNLVVNAIRHTTDPACGITIVLESGALSVVNAAQRPIAAPQLLFVRFGAAGSTGTGNKLGLAIAKAVCDYHGWRIGYSYAQSRHIFTVSFGTKA